MENFSGKVEFLWSVADLIRDHFKRGKYQDVILPLTVLRRIDCVLEPTKDKVVARYRELKGKLDNRDPQLRKASGYAFYNTSPYTFARLLGASIVGALVGEAAHGTKALRDGQMACFCGGYSA